ncbi:hypothetical protein [Confluentibacter citreus]|uniref:hypothetical protein n=1 Tax=Confluentibacter citreus TaxID=2007307 RepID=UPI0012FD8C6F|nr:hypothetical protein [Confluentibacter citreus]
MIRKTKIPFSFTYGEIFDDKFRAKIRFGFLRKKVLFQDFNYKIEIVKQNLFTNVFYVNNLSIKITHNLLNFYLKKPYSKIYCDNVLIAEVSLKKVFDLDGYNLILEFTNENEKEQNEICLVCFLIYSIETNLW